MRDYQTSVRGSDHVLHIDRAGTDLVWCGRRRSAVNRDVLRLGDEVGREDHCRKCVRHLHAVSVAKTKAGA
jgi:hypothetical protein